MVEETQVFTSNLIFPLFLIDGKNNKVEVLIESLGYTLVASLEKSNIIPV